MQGTVGNKTAEHVEVFTGSASWVGKFLGSRMESHRQRLVFLTLILSDALLALCVWEAAFVLQSAWGRGPLSEITIAAILPSVVVWVGLRALLGLYPGYGLDQVEELRRQTYAVLATLAVTATSAVAIQVGYMMSRLALVLGFVGLLLLAPLVRQLVKRWMMKVGLWGKPVVIMSCGEPGGRVATLLTEEWGLGYKPVAVFGSQQAPTKKRFEEAPDEGSLADAMELSRKRGVDTLVLAMPYTRRQHLELPPIGWQLFTLGGSQSDSTAFPSLLAIYATRLLAEPLSQARQLGELQLPTRHDHTQPGRCYELGGGGQGPRGDLRGRGSA